MMKRPGIRRMRQSRVDMQTMRSQLIALQERVTAQEQELAALRANEPTAKRKPQARQTSHRANRRALLQTAGVAAAAAVVGTIATHPAAALANDGQNMVIGTANFAESTTSLVLDGSTSATPDPLLSVDNSASKSTGGVGAIHAYANTGGTGLYAGASGYLSNGVFGFAFSDPTAAGLYGTSDTGYGVFGYAVSGVGLLVDGGSPVGGRIWQHVGTTTGAPTSGSYSVGEQLRDLNGDMFICVVAGTPGGWKKVAAGPIGYASGATCYLATPVRLLDSRAGATDATHTIGRRVDASDPYTLQVTSPVAIGNNIPSGAVGAFGNVTVVNTQGNGYLILYPTNGNFPATSNINYTASGQVISTAFNVGLSSDGKMTIACGGAGTDVIIDVAGFVI